MQTVSASLISEQQNQGQQAYYRIVELSRRYWNGAAFVWDTPVDISAYVAKVSTVKWKLDTQGFGQWLSPSFQVELKNEFNFWGATEQNGPWRSGLGGTQDYYVELSKIRVRIGHHLPNGTDEDVYAFGGLISKPLADHEEFRQATAYCVGVDELLRRASAEDLSTTVTDELLGSDSGTEFTTAQLGVGIVTAVKRGTTAGGVGAATTQTPQTHYTLSQLNEKTLGGKVTLATALTAGNSAWVSYKYWYQDKDLSWIVKQLLILAGVTNYQVEPTVFSTSVLTTITRTSAADFAAGVLQNIDIAATDGAFSKKWFLIDDFSDGDFTTAPVWDNAAYGTTGWSVSGGKLVASSAPQLLHVALARITGTWEIKMDRSSGYADFGIARTPGGFWVTPPNFFAYWVRIDGSTLYLYRGDNPACETCPAVDTVLASVAYTAAAGDVYRLDRDANGLMHVYVNGTLKITHTDNTISTTTTYNRFAVRASGSATFDDVYYCHSVAAEAHLTSTPLYTDQVLDAGVAITSWGSLTYTYSANGGSILVETLSASDAAFTNPDPDGWLKLSGTGQIRSLLNRYLKFRITLTPAASIGVIIAPEIQDVSVSYYVSNVTIPLVDMTNKTCYSAIQECAKYPGYEIGLTSTEKFFYRPRSSSSLSVLTIDKDTNLRQEVSFSTGTDQVFTRVKATFGSYRVTIDSDVLGEAAPNAMDKYGVKEFSISSSLLPKESNNIADSAARSIYAYVSVPRKRSQVEMKMLVQYELGDRVTYKREHKFGRWLWGDGDRSYGNDQGDFVFYSDPATSGWDIPMRIEGIELESEPKAMKLRYDLVEIPS